MARICGRSVCTCVHVPHACCACAYARVARSSLSLVWAFSLYHHGAASARMSLALIAVPCAWYAYFTRDARFPIVPTSNAAIFKPLDWSRCNEVLRPMARRIYLISFATDQDGAMMSHFLTHYIDRLGLLPSPMRVYVFAIPRGQGLRSRRASDVMHLLEQRGVHQAELLHLPYNDSYRISLVNARLRELPAGSWVTTPDVDEFYHFPCTRMGWLAERFDLFCGLMEDMLAASGGLEPLRDEVGAPDIQDQYPLRCRMRSEFLPHVYIATKPVLARVHPEALQGAARQFRNVHAFTSTKASATSPDCHRTIRNRNETRISIGPFAHYTLTREALWRTARKNQLHEKDYADRQRQRGTRSQLGDVGQPGEARSDTALASVGWSTCGSSAASRIGGDDGPCRDYAYILRGMETIYNASRGDGVVTQVLCALPNGSLSPAMSSRLPFNELLEQMASRRGRFDQ